MSSFAFLLCAFLFFLGGAQATVQVDPKTQFFVDDYGRVLLFHGVNIVFKQPPFVPDLNTFDPFNSLSPIDIQNLRTWGFNAVRLGMMWPGVEPQRGVFNYTYLQTMRTLVRSLSNSGIYVIVDAHQDLLSRYFCGEGVPDWLIPRPFVALPFPLPALEDPFPVDNRTRYPPLSECLSHEFARYYFSDAVGKAFQYLYTNHSGMKNSFASYWQTVSSYFKNESNVLGYELLNEPWGGDIYEDPSLLLPGVTDKQFLMPLYQYLHSVIRTQDNQKIIFFERSLTDLIGETGFSVGPGGSSYNNRQAYSYHVYCGGTDSDGNPRNVFECDGQDILFFERFYHDVENLGCGGFMTEFGAMDQVNNSIDAIRFLTRLADSYFQSWTYWQFKYYGDYTTAGSGEGFYDEQGNLEEEKVRELTRTYPFATAGTPVSLFFDPPSAAFEYTYILNTNIKLPTEIYLNEDWYYPKGYFIHISPSQTMNWTSPTKNFINLVPLQNAQNGVKVTVTIVRQ